MKLVQVYHDLQFDRLLLQCESVTSVGLYCRRLFKFGVKLGLGFTGGRIKFLPELKCWNKQVKLTFLSLVLGYEN